MRKCFNCSTEMPPETAHYEFDNEVYCTDCVVAHPYTSYSYYIGENYIADSNDDGARFVEMYDDENDPEEEDI